MHLTALTSVAAAVTGTVAVVATGAILAFSPQSDEPNVWFDYPVAAGTIYAGDVVVSAHTNEPKATAIAIALSQNGKVVTALTDSTLEQSGAGSGADILYTASSQWDAPVGVYDVTASVYSGSTVVQEEKSKLTVIAFKPNGLGTLPGGTQGTDPSASPSPSPSPTASATPVATPTATATPTQTDPPTPPKVTPTPEPTTPKPPKVTPTPEPPPPPLAGSVTRSNSSANGWTNTFTITGVRPQTAQVFVDINLHNEVYKPYFAGWQSYPCGGLTVFSGSGASATYKCTVTLTIQPPSNWTNGEFGTFMPNSVFRSKVVSGGKTYYGTGGNWSPTNGS